MLYEIFTIGMSDNCVSVYFRWMTHFLIDSLSLCLTSRLGGSPYPKIHGRKMADLLTQGYRMPKPRHVDDTL